MSSFFQFAINGLLVGGVYALIALGVICLYRATGVFNFAVGDMLLFGAFVCWTFMSVVQWPVWVALLIAAFAALILGFLIDRLVIRPLIGQPLISAIMATLGLSFFLRGVISFIWSPYNVSYPGKLLPGSPVRIANLVLSDELLWAFALAFMVFIFLGIFLQYGKIGLAMRGTAEDHQLARATGIRVKFVFSLSWAIASLVATIGGILLGARVGIGVGTTPLVALKIFPVVLFGGLESITGAIIGGLVVGMLENLAGGLISSKIAEITPYVILLIVLLIRPEGIFGLKRIERV